MSFNAPANDSSFTSPGVGDADSVDQMLAARKRAETQFAPSASLPQIRQPLEENFFTDDETLDFS